MTRKFIQVCYLAILIISIEAVVLRDEQNIDEGKHEADQQVVQDVENKVHSVPAVIDRIDADLPLSDQKDVKTEKEDLETANTFWGGYYRTPVWGWGRGWGYGGYDGYPSYRSYGWGGRGYNGWSNGYRGYYWR
ncbi:uncharacterized protein LOC123680948 [Harmonia axyridis]|uniref:uncharacterized protein LOC123680948 n=1 Tax=Harmonia axyridis TaxID=115357 RepID=UPI001E277F4D|nr:uncharacterized protein LOC123680948 [Harmonia axyridis]